MDNHAVARTPATVKLFGLAPHNSTNARLILRSHVTGNETVGAFAFRVFSKNSNNWLVHMVYSMLMMMMNSGGGGGTPANYSTTGAKTATASSSASFPTCIRVAFGDRYDIYVVIGKDTTLPSPAEKLNYVPAIGILTTIAPPGHVLTMENPTDELGVCSEDEPLRLHLLDFGSDRSDQQQQGESSSRCTVYFVIDPNTCFEGDSGKDGDRKRVARMVFSEENHKAGSMTASLRLVGTIDPLVPQLDGAGRAAATLGAAVPGGAAAKGSTPPQAGAAAAPAAAARSNVQRGGAASSVVASVAKKPPPSAPASKGETSAKKPPPPARASERDASAKKPPVASSSGKAKGTKRAATNSAPSDVANPATKKKKREDDKAATKKDANPNKHQICFYAPFCERDALDCGGFKRDKCREVNEGRVKLPPEKEFLLKKEAWQKERAKERMRLIRQAKAVDKAAKQDTTGTEDSEEDENENDITTKTTSSTKSGFGPKEYLILIDAFNDELTEKDLKYKEGGKVTKKDMERAENELAAISNAFDSPTTEEGSKATKASRQKNMKGAKGDEGNDETDTAGKKGPKENNAGEHDKKPSAKKEQSSDRGHENTQSGSNGGEGPPKPAKKKRTRKRKKNEKDIDAENDGAEKRHKNGNGGDEFPGSSAKKPIQESASNLLQDVAEVTAV
jgi:hypothetical protein